MEIQKKKKIIKKETEETCLVATYSVEEIANLIFADLDNKGYKSSEVTFNSNVKYEPSDDCGCWNPKAQFIGVEAKIEEA